MFSSDFNWDDIFLSHYLISVLIGTIVIIVTYLISKKYSFQKSCEEKAETQMSSDPCDSDKLNSNNIDHITPPVIKKSPALAAEKVIKANMTEEQRKLEYQVRQKQLAQIYELMIQQSDKFGKISLSDVEEQMKLYQ